MDTEMSERERVLLKILSVGVPCPEILVEEDSDICLDWSGDIDISITPEGKVNWAFISGHHGTDLEEFLEYLSKWFL